MICLPDFDGNDFNDFDFKTSVWQKRINDFLFYIMPDYFKQNDSYKDKNQRGLLERYIAVIAEEIDHNIIPYIECLLDVKNAKNTNENMLDHIADSLGSPTDLFINAEQYRSILSIMLNLYNIKGTKGYIETYFYILGFDITITKEAINTDYYNYDSGSTYDSGSGTYDSYTCMICFPYSVGVSTNSNYTGTGVTVEDLQTLKQILIKEQPINSDLINFNLI